MELIGHKRVLDFFTRVIEGGRLSHAYLLVGPEQVGKRAIAETVIAKILNCDRARLPSHPDMHILEQARDEKTDKLKKDISIEQMIDLRAALSRSAFCGGYQAALVDEAHKLNAKSANALLKTLEEPKANTIIFLTTTDEAELPATIVSRCQTLYISPVPRPEIAGALVALGADPALAEQMSINALGAPGRALQWLNDPQLYEAYVGEINRFQSLWGKPLYEKMKAIEPLFGDKTDHIAEREQLQGTMRLWELLNRNRLVENTVSATVGLAIARAIREAIDFLGKNVHPKLLLEQILLAIP